MSPVAARTPQAGSPRPGSVRATTGVLLALALVLGLFAQPFAGRALADQGTDVTAVVAGLDGEESALLEQQSTSLAPGLQLTSFQRRQDRAWVGGHVMTMDLGAKNLSLDVVDGGAVSGSNKTVSQFAAQAGPDVVAAINGDFYDMNATDAPVHSNISASGGVRTLTPSSLAFTMTDGAAAIERLLSTSQLVRPADGRTVAINGVNSPAVGNGVTLFTQAWGTYRLDGVLGTGPVRLLWLRDGRVQRASTAVADVAGPIAIAQGESIVAARGTAAVDQLAAFAVGDQLRVDVAASNAPDLAVGGSDQLVTNGSLTVSEQVTAGRTAIGISADGTRLFFVSIDGRRADAVGMTLQELARLMRDIGAWNAINLDGGGSTTLVGRPAGSDAIRVLNRPSDGNERLVSNALVIRSTARAVLADVHVHPASETPGTASAQQLRLVPGLTRTVAGSGLDEAGHPITSFGTFAAGPQVALTAVGDRASVKALAPGSGTLTYTAGGHQASLPYRVVGPLARLVASSSLVALPGPEGSATLRLDAVDADGNRVPVEVYDAQVSATGPVRVEPSGLASWRVTGAENGSGTITLTAGGHSTTVAVTVGTVDKVVSTFADPSLWRTEYARATGSLSAATGPNGEPALRMQYDFTTSTSTRGAYAVSTSDLPVEGQPQALSLWIKGDGSGVWPRIQVKQANGVVTNVDGPNVTWTGWQQVTFPVPAGTAYPLVVQRVRFMETRSTVRYQGDLTIAGLAAKVPADVDLPEAPYVHDPVIVTNGTVDKRPLRVAVMSDAQFVGRNPDSPLVASARRTMREIVAAKPDFVVINGDLVDEANDIDFELAKTLLDEEFGGKVAYQYVPGNHEVMGQPIANFATYFGDTRTVRDLRGTRLITLDSSSATLHPGGVDQLRWLEARLAEAKADPQVTGVVLFNHHPIDDPLPDKASQLGDRTEAAALQRLMARFRAGGKHIAHVNGHVGAFHADAVDGVSRIINGNSGKAPAGPADHGGWVGWTMLGIDPARGVVGTDPAVVADRIGWLRAETHPQVDSLTLTVDGTAATATTMPTGGQLAVAGVITQTGRGVPVQWPVSARWGGERVAITTDDPLTGEQDFGDVGYRFNPDTGVLAWNGGGTATLTLTVNGVTTTLSIDAPAKTPGTGPVAGTNVLGDHTGDRIADLFAVDRSGGLQFFSPTAGGPARWLGQVGRGWQDMTALAQVNDLTGDGRPDLLARRGSDNALLLYRGTGNGRLALVGQVGRHWGGVDQIVPAFNLAGGSTQYVVARRTSDGALVRYQLTPAGLTGEKQIGWRWNGARQILSTDDVTGDGVSDILAIKDDGTLWRYETRPDGRLAAGVQVGHGWDGFTRALTPGDLDGDGRYDLVGQRADGTVFAYRNLMGRWGAKRQLMTGTSTYRLLA